MLVGRERELAALASALDAARAGSGRALVVQGEAGVGKTALLDAFAAEAGAETLRARAQEAERQLPYAGLAMLLSPLVGRLDDLPETQAAALRGALALGPAAPQTALATAAGAVSLVALAAEAEPFLLVVDDAHWLDPASAAVVAFLAHRISPLPALLLLAAREGEQLPSALAPLPALRVEGLATEAAARLLGRDRTRPVAPEVARRLAESTAGNPLALLELQRQLGDEERTGTKPLADSLPVGPTIERLFRRRVEQLPPETQAALLRAAADAGWIVLADDAATLEPAALAGLVGLHRGRCEFRHPLVAAAVYEGAPEHERRRAHLDAADSPASAADPLRRARHLMLAATGPDESVAEALAAAAGLATARGGVVEAAATLAMAARLTPDPSTRGSRLVDAARVYVIAGDFARSAELLAEAEALVTTDVEHAQIEHVKALITVLSGAPMSAHHALVGAAERVAPDHAELAVPMLIDAVPPAFTAARLDDAIAAARRAEELARTLGGEVVQQAQALLASALALAGRSGDRTTAGERLRTLGLDILVPSPLAPTLALALVWLERYDDARQLLVRWIAKARGAGALSVLTLASAAVGELETWSGVLSAAVAATSEGIDLAETIGDFFALPYLLVTAARIAAIQGRDASARPQLAQALDYAGRIGTESIAVYAGSVEALLALGADEPQVAIAALEPVWRFTEERGVHEPNVVPWLGDYIEANQRAGNSAEAERALARLDRESLATGSRWGRGAVARYRAVTAPGDDYEELFREALELHEAVPFEHARTELAYGRRLRDAGETARGIATMRSAERTFARLGAAPWLGGTRRELEAAGERVEPSAPPVEQLLTQHELQVALLVSEGATNKEVAARLFVTPKTVEFHLGKAYRKLDVRGRVELARALRGELGERGVPVSAEPHTS